MIPAAKANPAQLRTALAHRVTAACRALGLPATADLGDDLALIVDVAQDPATDDVLWLALTCVMGRLPVAQEVRSARCLMDTSSRSEVTAALLAQALTAGPFGLDREIEIVPGAVAVQLGSSGGHAEREEIALLAAEVIPRWRTGHAVVTTRPDGDRPGTKPSSDRSRPTLVVPWHGTAIVLGTPSRDECDQLSALAQSSGTRLGVIPPDMLPVARPESVDRSRSESFGALLGLLKHAHRVVTLTDATARGYEGLALAVAAQGLPGPTIRAVLGALSDASGTRPEAVPDGPVTVISLGDDVVTEATVVHAAEALWARGAAFTLVLADSPHSGETSERIAPARRGGHVIRAGVREGPDGRDGFAVALSPGGLGLLLGDALSRGIPAIVANYGTPAELARHGGCLAVDPDDDDAVIAAMDMLLTDPSARVGLADAARNRPARSWDALSAELWHALTDEASR